jgi:hypothetical protein
LSFGAAEDHNDISGIDDTEELLVAVIQRGDRGSQPHRSGHVVHRQGRGGRPPGRPRIATYRPRSTPQRSLRGGRPLGRTRIATPTTCTCSAKAQAWRSSPGTTEDRNDGPTTTPLDINASGSCPSGGRGSQLHHVRVRVRGHRLPWRPFSGAIEDRNWTGPSGEYEKTAWRSPSGVTEDRNLLPPLGLTYYGAWRSPSGGPRIAT